MRESTRKAFDRLNRSMDRALERQERRQSRGGCLSKATILLALALLLNGLLIRYFVPAVWSQFIPGGVPRVTYVMGWPGLLARTTVYAVQREPIFWATLGLAWFAIAAMTAVARSTRLLAWVATALLVGSAAFIVFVTMRTSMIATLSSVPQVGTGL